MLIYGNTPGDITKIMFKKKWKILGIVMAGALVVGLASTQLKADTLEPTFDRYGQDAGMGMDYDGRNPGNDKIECLKYEDCPEWDGNAETKIYYDLMKLKNGTGIIAKSDFNWNVHLYSCHQNKLLDSINGEGAFERLAIISAKNGMVPCPIGVNPHWSYDWESHILKAQMIAKLNRLTMLWPKKPLTAGPMGPQDLMNSTPDVE
jgi:hypothetical protein